MINIDKQTEAITLLQVLWQSIDIEYKSKYSLNIWQQFEDNVRSVACTPHIGKFIDNLSRKLPIRIENKNVEIITTLINTTDSKQLLKMFREETKLLILYVRLENQKRKDEKEWTIKPTFFEGK